MKLSNIVTFASATIVFIYRKCMHYLTVAPNFQEAQFLQIGLLRVFLLKIFSQVTAATLIVTFVLCKMADSNLSPSPSAARCSLCYISQRFVQPLNLHTIFLFDFEVCCYSLCTSCTSSFEAAIEDDNEALTSTL